MKLGPYLILAGAGLAAASPLNVRISTTEVSAIRFGHAAANSPPVVGSEPKPTRIRHICKNMQKAVQDTATRFLTIIGIHISGPRRGVTRIQITHHKLVPAPDGAPPFMIKAGGPEGGPRPGMALMHHKVQKGCHSRAPFLQRVHRALVSLGPWEGRVVAFILGCGIGVLLRMFWVLAVLLARGGRSTPEREEETILVYAEEVAPPYEEGEEKRLLDGEN
ncbi:hypothetical protein BC826DRAFT_1055813 [Russula brevipes]|nr:hypothetical protein BC826DRAFT_1055813 [Russula brevipes]